VGLQLVMAPDQVWETFLKVCVPSFYCQVITNIQYIASLIPQAPFQEKGFPLFDKLAYLCDDVLATGVGAFRGTRMGSGI